MKHFLLRFIADAARIVKNQFRLIRRRDLGITFADERTDDFLRIVSVHLAAEGFDVEVFHCCPYCTGNREFADINPTSTPAVAAR
jgi:hypothetical protein